MIRRVAVGVVLSAGVLLLTNGGSADAGPRFLPACEYEDSVGCWWDAESMGNGKGSDVVTLEER